MKYKEVVYFAGDSLQEKDIGTKLKVWTTCEMLQCIEINSFKQVSLC